MVPCGLWMTLHFYFMQQYLCVGICYVKVRKLEQKVQHLTESQHHSDQKQAKLKDENGQFVERYSFTHHCHADIFTLQFNQKICSQFMIEFTETTLPFLLTVTLDLDLRCWFSIPDELWSWPIHMQKIKVRGYAVLMLKWKQMDRQTDMTEFITFLQISC